jgi:hypothetical protein
MWIRAIEAIPDYSKRTEEGDTFIAGGEVIINTSRICTLHVRPPQDGKTLTEIMFYESYAVTCFDFPLIDMLIGDGTGCNFSVSQD